MVDDELDNFDEVVDDGHRNWSPVVDDGLDNFDDGYRNWSAVVDDELDNFDDGHRNWSAEADNFDGRSNRDWIFEITNDTYYNSNSRCNFWDEGQENLNELQNATEILLTEAGKPANSTSDKFVGQTFFPVVIYDILHYVDYLDGDDENQE
ncbi:hypothetical protein OCU04_006104 [Sclerotinia nivalis]|uniref:Uncharacterized protein n=1 Tax=Sclerotinia nivalis TaxID=352851 RepID=A0A9X0DKW8_9HELO|nr:hypothetical protein OCU04_006104 [Sclerotinia nivalis]